MPYAVVGEHVREPRAGGVGVRAAAAPAVAERVRALQQTAGNAATTKLLQPRASIRMSVKRGALGHAVRRRTDLVFKDDLLVFRAEFERVRNPSASVGAHLLLPPGLTVESAGWKGDAFVWNVRAGTIGKFRLDFQLEGPVSKHIVRTIDVVSDSDYIRDSTLKAAIDLRARFSRIHSRLHRAEVAFAGAYDNHKNELNAASAGELLDKQILWGVVFAGLGGFLGAAAGGVLKPEILDALKRADALGRRPKLTLALNEGFTDLAKDMVKFGVRTGGKPSTPTIGDSTAPPHQPSQAKHQPQDDRKPVLESPTTFYGNLAAAMEDEEALLLEQLSAFAGGLLTDRGRDAKKVFNEDPVALVSRADQLLDTITRQTDTDENHYYEALWGAWVRAFYYRIELDPVGAKYGHAGYRLRTPSRHIDKALENAAKTLGHKRRGWFGEGGDLQWWLDKYGDRSVKDDRRLLAPWQVR